MSGFERNLAVIIGINEYKNGIPSLQTAVNDAKKLNQLLRLQHEYHNWILLDRIASLENIYQLLENTLPQQVNINDRLLFYFAGHGIALNDEDGANGYLIPQDAVLGDVNTYLPMVKLQKALSALPCRHFLGILDCCFAGAFRWSSTRDLLTVPEVIHQERFDRFINDPAWQVITSADYDQKALDAFSLDSTRGQIGENSPFASALLEALEGKGDVYPPGEPGKPSGDGVITATELYLYLRDRVEIATEKHRQRQTPGIWALNKHDKGEYIFLNPGHELNLPPAPPLDESQNPYRGLNSFEEEDSDLFFGRQELVDQLYQTIIKQSLTVVLGASGTGKSSLVKAGLIPYLKSRPESWHIFTPIRPGEFPLMAMNNTLAEGNLTDVATSVQVPKLDLKILRNRLDYWCKTHSDSQLLLVIDQSEELITLCQDEQEREQFIEWLAWAIATYPQQLHLILTARSDFEPQLQASPLQEDWLTGRFIVPPMTREELRQAIEQPASARVIYFEPHSLVEQLIDEVVQMPGALPLLSFTLSELYLKYLSKVREGTRDKRAITQQDYQELGGVTRSLTQRADSEYEKLVKQDKAYSQTIRNVMLRMIAVSSGELARRRVLLEELEYPEPENTRVKEVIHRFSAARLLVEGQDLEEKPYVEPAHDALVRGWQKLLTWKQEQEESLILQRRLTPAAREWENQQKVQYLWNANPYLDVLKQQLKSDFNWFNQLEAEFIQRSIKRKNRNRNVRTSLLLAFILGLIGVIVVISRSERETQIQQISASQESAENNLSSNQSLDGMINVLKAGRSLKHPLLQLFKPDPNLKLQEQVEGTLQTAIYTVRESNRLEDHQGTVRSRFNQHNQLIASAASDGMIRLWNLSGEQLRAWSNEQSPVSNLNFSPDEKLLATTSNDGIVRLWNLQGQRLARLIGHNGLVRSVGFSPDNKLLASGGKDGTVHLWNSQGKLLENWEADEDVWNVVFSPDGQQLASVGNDSKIRLWNLQGQLLKEWEVNQGKLHNIIFSKDGQLLATGGEDFSISIWHRTGHKLADLEGHQGQIWSLMFSQDNQQLISSAGDGTARIWDLSAIQSEQKATIAAKSYHSLQDSNLKIRLRGHRGPVRSAGFTTDEQQLVTSGDDGTVRLWDLQKRELATLGGDDSSVRGVTFSPDGRILVSAGDDDNIHLWNLSGKQVKQWQTKHKIVKSVIFSPNGQQLATAGDDGNIRLWNLSGKQINQWQTEHAAITTLDFSPDGHILASVGDDSTIRLWNLQGKQLSELKGHQDRVRTVQFSPNGELLASGGDDSTVRLWNLKDQANEETLEGHLGSVYSLSFSPDGQRLASAGNDGTIRLWNLKTNKKEQIFQGFETKVYALAFTPDGQKIVGSYEDGTIRLWDLQGTQLTQWQGHNRAISSPDLAQLATNLDFSPDGQLLASTGDDSTAKLWRIESLDKLIQRSCDWMEDYLRYNPTLEKGDQSVCQ